jgi:hypothetical protein
VTYIIRSHRCSAFRPYSAVQCCAVLYSAVQCLVLERELVSVAGWSGLGVCLTVVVSKCSLLLAVISIRGYSLQPSGHYMYRQFTAQWSLYVPPVYSPVVSISTASLQPSGYYMYRQFTAQWSLYVPSHSTILRSAHSAVFMCFVWI